MSIVVSIHQPSYFSWFGLLHKIIKSDIFIVLDNVQFNKRAFQHRTLYSNNSGKPSYLTLSVDAKNHQRNNISINQIKFKNSNIDVLQKHKQIFDQRFKKSNLYKQYQDRINDIFKSDEKFLFPVIMKTFNLMLDIYGVKTKILYASNLNVEGTKSELMLNLTKAAGGDIYLSGRGAEDYMEDKLFFQNNVDVIYQDFVHIKFDQKLKKDFQFGCFALELPFLHENFKDLFYAHYKEYNQLDLIRGMDWNK